MTPVDLAAIREKATFRPLWYAEVASLCDELEATRQRLVDTTTALDRYGSHIPGCDVEDYRPVCSCGLDAALAAVAPAPPTGPARRGCGCLDGYPCGLGCALLVAAAPPTEPTDWRSGLDAVRALQRRLGQEVGDQ